MINRGQLTLPTARRMAVGRSVVGGRTTRVAAAPGVACRARETVIGASCTGWSGVPTGTVTSCPYKGMTSGYWSVHIGDAVHKDLAWAYDFPTRDLLPIAGLIAFYNEKVDVIVDGEQLARPQTHFS